MRSKKSFIAVTLLALFVLPMNAYAMHIGEGILPFDWCALWYGVAMPFVAIGLYKLKKDKTVGRMKPLLGMVAAAIFIVSCMPIPVPTAGTCSHPAGTRWRPYSWADIHSLPRLWPFCCKRFF